MRLPFCGAGPSPNTVSPFGLLHSLTLKFLCWLLVSVTFLEERYWNHLLSRTTWPYSYVSVHFIRKFNIWHIHLQLLYHLDEVFSLSYSDMIYILTIFWFEVFNSTLSDTIILSVIFFLASVCLFVFFFKCSSPLDSACGILYTTEIRIWQTIWGWV